MTGELLGRGGFADVWAAVHVATGWQVAIKQPRAESVAILGESLSTEARALAQLQHPGIVRILDVLDGDCIVMERATATVAERPPAQWSALRALLLSALDALAHVHSHGLLHRDIKPSNMLLGVRREPREPLVLPTDGFRLSDFGIAVQATQDVSWPMAGSPSFQAPEQRDGDRASFGPWSDLFALGRVAQALSARIPSTPPGFIDWIRWLTHAEVPDRPDRAIEAAAGLLLLGEPQRDRQNRPPPPPDLLEGSTLVHLEPIARKRQHQRPPLALKAGHRRLPDDWRIGVPWWPTIELLDAGAGMQHLRHPQIVGQEALRDRLWKVLQAVAAQNTPMTISLQGPVGIGRRALAQWLAVRAHAVGAAEVERIDARHPWVWEGPPQGPLRAASGGRVRLLIGLDIDSIEVIDAVMQEAAGPILAVLARGDRGAAWAVPPLTEADLRRLIRETLPLAPGLMEHLIDRSAGVPGAALRWIQRWSRDGQLTFTVDGFTHINGTRPIIGNRSFSRPYQEIGALIDQGEPEQAWAAFSVVTPATLVAHLSVGFDILDALGARADDPRRLRLEILREKQFGVHQPGQMARLTALSRMARQAGLPALADDVEMNIAMWQNSRGAPQAALDRMRAVHARAVARGDQHTRCWATICMVSPLTYLGRVEEALAHADRGIRLAEDHPRELPSAFNERARALRSAGRYDEGVAACRAGLRILTDDQIVFRQRLLQNLASLLKASGRGRAAIDVYEEMIAFDVGQGWLQEEAISRNNLGWLQLCLGNIADAERSLRIAVDRYLRTNRSDHIVRVGLAVAYAFNKKIAAAREILAPLEVNAAEQYQPMRLARLLVLGWCAAAMGEVDRWPSALDVMLAGPTFDPVSLRIIAKRAAEVARSAGWIERAEAIEQWHARAEDRPTA
ncbi:MAG: protein kinase family protein, partial [Myxococcota bacterium]